MVHVEKFNTEQQLCDIYCDPMTGFQSKERLYQKAKEEGLTFSRKSVGEWLKSQDVYTWYKPIVRKLPAYRKTWVRNVAEYSKENGGNKWILTSIEILSRYTFATPVYRKDTKNMTTAIRDLLTQFYDGFGTYPKLAQSGA